MVLCVPSEARAYLVTLLAIKTRKFEQWIIYLAVMLKRICQNILAEAFNEDGSEWFHPRC